jgi:uncharacterized membrane protein YjdF
MVEILNQFFLPYIILVLIAAVAAHFIGGAMKLYDTTNWFDIVFHILTGAFLLTVSGFWIGENLLGIAPKFAVIFAFCFTVAAGAVWELLEFTCDTVFKTNMQRWRDKNFSPRRVGLIDSMTDLAANLFGGLISCAVIFALISI